MSVDTKNVGHEPLKRCRCPECFKKEKDIWLKYDREDDEYYCVKCCYFAKNVGDIMDNFDRIRKDKFKL